LALLFPPNSVCSATLSFLPLPSLPCLHKHTHHTVNTTLRFVPECLKCMCVQRRKKKKSQPWPMVRQQASRKQGSPASMPCHAMPMPMHKQKSDLKFKKFPSVLPSMGLCPNDCIEYWVLLSPSSSSSSSFTYFTFLHFASLTIRGRHPRLRTHRPHHCLRNHNITSRHGPSRV